MHNNFQERIIAILRGSPNGLTSNEITELLGPTAKNMNSRLSKLAAWNHRQSPPQLRPKEALMPFIVVRTVVSFLRRRAYTKKQGERTANAGAATPRAKVHSITSSARASSMSGGRGVSGWRVLSAKS